ncbi:MULTISPECIES: LicD family protein [unclassified Breznakia]|uniref:LicD family protein n=1 Tax=unclassified Breznakia TaxID=2623764 RepID=UPI002404D3E3|nr:MULTISPECIES: LicD family protein [unclassified Breznakia]MDF9836943.1 lipopolysaccharide cholinephosphotransferase [Breznakia sp. PFB2-8]MDF9859579.1 lipopolysaccharide cholinephosphotransferase [Breznakia sp. PH5-24]
MDNTSTLKNIQKIELEIAAHIFDLCRKHKLTCVLAGGSCLGAIRHKGMIPWDDDIDLAMPRNDYERFIELCEKELSSKYFFQHLDSEENCAYIFGKVRKNNTKLTEEYSHNIKMHQGIWVDIFPYDNISDSHLRRKFNNMWISFYKNLLIVKVGFGIPRNSSFLFSVAYYISKIISLFFSKKFLKKKLRKHMLKYNNQKTEKIRPYAGAYGEAENMSNDLFENPIEVDFNGYKFLTFKDYDMYLTKLYGDYMTPPPPEKRNGGNHHIKEVICGE